MHATIRRYEGVDATRMNEVAGKVNETLVPQLRQLPGFSGYYLIEAGNGVLSSFGLFKTSDQADESTKVVAKWITDENRGRTNQGHDAQGAQDGDSLPPARCNAKPAGLRVLHVLDAVGEQVKRTLRRGGQAHEQLIHLVHRRCDPGTSSSLRLRVSRQGLHLASEDLVDFVP